ncbi:MAG: hypothetical protein J1E84_02530, partial [Muribaculaceae bacterium]|nr:hypothetical protein [Muribaculaceae bacterium]
MKRTAINITRAYSMAVVALLSLLSGVVTAQSLYDDDLYGNPGKKSSKEVKQEAPAEAVYVYESPVAVRAEQSLSTVSVDEYNRRGFFAVDETVADSVATEEAETLGDIAYTRRIEAFHNPDV